MSRSRRKTPITGWCNGSDKDDKRRANRRLRKRINERLRKERVLSSDKPFPEQKETSNVWEFNKDGKMWFGGDDDPYFLKLWRK